LELVEDEELNTISSMINFDPEGLSIDNRASVVRGFLQTVINPESEEGLSSKIPFTNVTQYNSVIGGTVVDNNNKVIPAGTYMTLGTLTFEAIQAGEYELNLPPKREDKTLPRTSYLSKRNGDETSFIENLTLTPKKITISDSGATVTLKVSFQGRPTTSSSQNSGETLEVVWAKNSFAISESQFVITDENGETQIELPSEDSDLSIWVKGERSLARLQSVGNVVAGDRIVIEQVLLGGDANNNNAVDFPDFGIFSGSYDKNVSVDGDRRADFNNSGTVDFPDFGIFSGNYDATGAARPPHN